MLRFFGSTASLLLASLFYVPDSVAICPTQPRLDNFVGGGSVVCPCFAAGEEAGAVFQLPPNVFPIEILRVGIGWASQFGGAPSSLEDAILIYPSGLPNPGSPVFSLGGPVLVDGAINEFNLEPLPGQAILSTSPFTVTLRFANDNAGDPFSPSVVHDGAGCHPGHNVVRAMPGGWFDSCSLGVSGQWVFYVVYRQVSCGGGTVPDGQFAPGVPLTASRVSGDVHLAWSASCAASDQDYAVYAGTIGSFYNHAPQLCTTSGALSASFTPGPGNEYYLVVPKGSQGEGSYGKRSTGAERPPGTSACAAQQTVSCP